MAGKFKAAIGRLLHFYCTKDPSQTLLFFYKNTNAEMKLAAKQKTPCLF